MLGARLTASRLTANEVRSPQFITVIGLYFADLITAGQLVDWVEFSTRVPVWSPE